MQPAVGILGGRTWPLPVHSLTSTTWRLPPTRAAGRCRGYRHDKACHDPEAANPATAAMIPNVGEDFHCNQSSDADVLPRADVGMRLAGSMRRRPAIKMPLAAAPADAAACARCTGATAAGHSAIRV